ncbi:kinase D-interacting substrate [Rhizoctonia solani]|uniref:Kinase D-interacting substrate n=1 Tax=Rhizoctonia solani TaxID=456999 RepID=A0A8H8P4M7_9AGAM|nr:kinase D-interacting substrate [Rhizoctonia solani]QRW23753.1 kinase D-interacting substrate [Rhizoctonia solani]
MLPHTKNQTRQKGKGSIQPGNPHGSNGPVSGQQQLGESVTVEDPQVWTLALTALEQVTLEGRTANEQDIHRETEIAQYRKGYAVLRFVGQGAVQGVVQIDQDPNHRANPRPLNKEHLAQLTSAIATNGVIGDRQTPVRVRAPPAGLDPTLEQQMKAVDITNPASPIPTLQLIRENPDREEQLERELFALSDGNRLLSQEEVTERKVQLAQLRKGRKLAYLLNGNHRISAMIAACEPLVSAALYLAMCERNRTEDFDAKTEWENLTALVSKATYVVEVFDYNTPPHVIAWLSENEQAQPQYSPLAGETLWSLVQSQETTTAIMIKEGKALSREDAIAKINTLRYLQQASKLLDPNQTNPLGQSSKLSTRRRGISLGDKECLELMSYPTTMEMVCDTRMALCVYNNRITNSHADALRSDQGAAFVAHVWMGMRLLNTLANTTLGTGLSESEDLVASFDIQNITPTGLEESSTLFSNLISKPQEVPALLSYWEPSGHSIFEELLAKHIYGKGLSVCKGDYYNPTFVCALRRTYFELGIRLCKRSEGDEKGKRLGVATSLYALLPIWRLGTVMNQPAFYPAAILPCKTVYSAYEKSIKSTGETVANWTIELLLDRFQLPWTAGSTTPGKSCQSANWSSNLGPMEARLSTALNFLEDSRLDAAIHAINETRKDDNSQKLVAGFTAQELCIACHAMKTGVVNHPILSRIMPRIGSSHGTLGEVQKKLIEARKGVKSFLLDSNQTVGQLYSAHPILNLIPQDYFVAWNPREWAQGWNDDDRKLIGTATALIGWFLISKELRLSILPTVFSSLPQSRFLLHMIRRLHSLGERIPWWDGAPGFIEDSPNITQAYAPGNTQPENNPSQDRFRRGKRNQPPTKLTTITGSSAGAFEFGSSPSTTVHPNMAGKKSNKVLNNDLGMSPVSPQAAFLTSDCEENRTLQKEDNGNSMGQYNKHGKNCLTSAAFSDSINPGHVLVGRPTLLEGGIDSAFACQDHSIPTSLAAVNSATRKLDSMEEVIEMLMKERQNLRRSLSIVCHTASKGLERFPYAPEYAVSALPYLIQMCKDAFISRIAVILAEHWGEADPVPGAGMLDALAIAATDGLYDSDLFTIDSQGKIQLNLKRTYPMGIQSELEQSQYAVNFKNPVGGGDPIDLNSAWERMSQFIPTQGYGRTISEASSRGVEGLFATVANESLANKPQFRTFASPAIDAEDTPRFDDNMPNLHGLRDRIRELLSKSKESLAEHLSFDVVTPHLHTMVHNYHPSISTGVYNGYVTPNTPPIVQSAAEAFQLEANSRWADIVQSRLEVYPPPSTHQLSNRPPASIAMDNFELGCSVSTPQRNSKRAIKTQVGPFSPLPSARSFSPVFHVPKLSYVIARAKPHSATGLSYHVRCPNPGVSQPFGTVYIKLAHLAIFPSQTDDRRTKSNTSNPKHNPAPTPKST